MAYSECLPTRLNSLAERTCFSQVIGCIGGQPDGRYGWNCSGLPGGARPQFPAIKSRDVSLAATGANWSYGLLSPGRVCH